jgi:hypothetical protein
MNHLVAVFRKFYLLSDKPETNADSRLHSYIRLYESVARGAWFTGACLFGLGLGSKGKFKATILETVMGIKSWDDVPPAVSQFAAAIILNPAGVILAIVTVNWHHGYLRHVKKETEIIASCFEKDQKPRWDQVAGARFAPFIGAWLFIAFSGLCLLVGHVKWYAAVAIVLNLGDFAGNDFTRKNLLKAFKEEEFRTRNKVLLARREIALEYWSEKWQLPRILIMLMANVLALMIANDMFGIQISDIVPYALVTIAILANEYVITTWRIERDAKLKKFPVPEAETDSAGKTGPARTNQKPAKKKRSDRRSARKPQADSGE